MNRNVLASVVVVLATSACGGGTAEEKTNTTPPLTSASVASTATPPTPGADHGKEMAKLAAQAFVFGYSPLFMERQERTMTTNARLPLGTFAHASKLPKAEDSDVLPSLDTLLSSAWVELGAGGAYALKLPDMGGRWFVVQMFDAYGEPIGVAGTKTTGTKAQQIVMTGPNFTGTVPAGATQIKSTTSTVWLIAHTHVTGDADVTRASALLKQWSLAPVPPTVAPKDLPPSPLGRPQDLKFGGPEIFDELGDILKNEPPPADINAPDFTKAGIGAGLTPNKTLKQEDLASLSQGVKDGAEQVEQALEKLAVRKNGWDLDANFGKRGQEPSRQAATVLRGLGNWPVASEALVYIARVDDGDRVLAGAHDYVVHFDKGKLPPAKAFWSISMYSARTAGLVPGAKRAELTDVAAKKSPDGSLDVILQGDAPAKNESNWLPAPKADSFILVLRVFQPADDAASWEAPVVKRIK